MHEKSAVMSGVVGRVVGGGDRDGTRERHGFPLHDRSERVWTDDAVATEVHSMLQESHATERRAVEVRVHRDVDPLPDEHELEHGYVPAELAAPQRARAEERSSERTERLPRARIGDARDTQAVGPLATVFGPETASIEPR